MDTVLRVSFLEKGRRKNRYSEPNALEESRETDGRNQRGTGIDLFEAAKDSGKVEELAKQRTWSDRKRFNSLI